MARRTPRQRGIAYLSAALAVLGLGLVAALVLNTGAAPAQARVELDNALMVSTRDQLRVCVQQAPALGAEAGRTVERITAQLDRAKGHPDWAGAFGRAGRVDVAPVTVGGPRGGRPPGALANGLGGQHRHAPN